MVDRGGKLVDSVCVCVDTVFYVSLLHMPVSKEDYVGVHVFQTAARVEHGQGRVHTIEPLFTTRTLDLHPPYTHLFITCSHLPFSYLGLFYFISLPLPPFVSPLTQLSLALS